MGNDKQPLSILVIGVSREVVDRFTADCGLNINQVETYGSRTDAIAALRGHKRYDVIITSYGEPLADEVELLRQINSFDCRKDTPVVMLSQQARD